MSRVAAPKVIWYISKYVVPPPDPNTQGGRGYELVRRVASRGHDCTIFTSDANPFAKVPELRSRTILETRDGLRFCWIRSGKYTKPQSIRRVITWIRFEWGLLRARKHQFGRPDVIVVSSLSVFTILTGLWFKIKYRSRLVIEIRDIWPLTLVAEGGWSPRHPLIRILGWIERLGYRHADAIIGTMPNLREHVARQIGEHPPVHCVPMGYDPVSLKAPTPLPSGYVETFFPGNKFIVGYAGTIGVTNFLEPLLVAATALSTHDDIHFVLAGDGDERERLAQEFEHLDNVSWAPKVPKSSVQEVLRRCDVLFLSTMPSEIWRYGQSLNKLIDYMLAGRPIVASYGGYRSMINEADCGVFVTPGDSEELADQLLNLFQTPRTDLQRIGERGREWLLSNRSYETLAEQFEAILLATERQQ